MDFVELLWRSLIIEVCVHALLLKKRRQAGVVGVLKQQRVASGHGSARHNTKKESLRTPNHEN